MGRTPQGPRACSRTQASWDRVRARPWVCGPVKLWPARGQSQHLLEDTRVSMQPVVVSTDLGNDPGHGDEDPHVDLNTEWAGSDLTPQLEGPPYVSWTLVC